MHNAHQDTAKKSRNGSLVIVLLLDFLCLEGHQDYYLHPLIEEMLHWREIIGTDYHEYKLSC